MISQLKEIKRAQIKNCLAVLSEEKELKNKSKHYTSAHGEKEFIMQSARKEHLGRGK